MDRTDPATRLDTLLTVQAARLAPIAGPELVAATRAGAAPTGGDVLEAGGIAGVVEVVEHAAQAFERVVLGDRTVFLHLVALPDPADPEAATAVTAWLAAATALAGPLPGRRTQFFLRWPAADTAMAPVLESAGLATDALWSIRPAAGLPAARSAATVRFARPEDAAQVGDLAVEELRYHLPLTPFSRDLPVAREWIEQRVTEPEPGHPVVVAEHAGGLGGYAVCRIIDTPDDGRVRPAPPGRTGHLLSVGVAGTARGAGIGGAMVAAAGAHLAAAGATRLSAAFVPGNPTAAPFWRGRGFVPRWACWAGMVT